MVTKTPAKKAKVANGAASAKKAAVKTPKAKAKPVSDLDSKTYVASAKLTESLSVVRKLKEVRASSEAAKKDLFESDAKFVSLQVELKKIPANFTTFIHTIPVPKHWRHSTDLDTCLIVPDLNREPLDDRDLDLEQTKAKYLDKLEEADASELIKEILPMRQLRNEFRPYPLKQKLSSQYNVFLCDRKLFRNKHNFLSRFLGKAFWVDHKKVPLMIDFSVDPSELKQQIESKLDQTTLYVSGKGNSLSVCVGSLDQTPTDLLANLVVILEKINEIYANNVRALTLKSDKSQAVTFFMDLGSSNDVTLAKAPTAQDEQERFVEDEFDFLTNSSVRVFRDGTIRVMKRKAPEGEEAGEEEEEEADESEQKFIRNINESFAAGDHDWVRHKVAHVNKPIKKNSKKLKGNLKRRFNGGAKQKRFFKVAKTNGNKKAAKTGGGKAEE